MASWVRAPRARAGPLAHCFERVNAQKTPVLALDLPSGLDADTGAAPGAVLRATVTQSLLLPKRGAFTGEARNWVGTLTHADLACRLLPMPPRAR